jgi:hypothetical protein
MTLRRFRPGEKMPAWARLLTGVVSIALLAVSAALFSSGPDANWKQILVAFIAAGMSIDLLVGAFARAGRRRPSFGSFHDT